MVKQGGPVTRLPFFLKMPAPPANHQKRMNLRTGGPTKASYQFEHYNVRQVIICSLKWTFITESRDMKVRVYSISV